MSNKKVGDEAIASKKKTLEDSRLTLQEYIKIWERICPDNKRACKNAGQLLEELLA